MSEPTARRSVWDRVPTPVSVTAFSLVLIAFWQVLVSSGAVSSFVMPPPMDVARQIGELGEDFVTFGYVWDNFLITAQEVALGFVLSAVVGIGLGVAVAKTAFGRRVLRPFLVALYAAPKIALAPIFVTWFGFGVTPKVVMAAFIGFFPLLVDTVAGLAGTDRNEQKLFRVVRANRVQTFVKLELPTALPYIFAGLKSAAVLTVIGAVVGEFMGGGDGLGALIKTASTQLALDRVFAYVVVLSALAYAFYALIDVLERRLVFWRKASFMPDGH